MTRRQFIAVLIVAFALRLVLILRDPLWYDENFSLALARLPLPRLIDATAGDVHPPYYYVLLWAWEKLVGSEPAWLMRIPSLLLGMGAILLMARITRRAAMPQAVQIAATLFMCFSPFQVYYSSETRMYALLGFLVLAGVDAIQNQQWARLGIIAAALAYTHNWGLLYDAALFALAVLTNAPRLWKVIILPFAFAAVLWLPWALTLYGQMSDINQSYWLTRVSPGLVILQLHQMVWGMIYNPLASMVTFIALAIGIYTISRDDSRAAALALVMFGLPYILGIVISVAWQPIMLFRAMAGISPFAGLLMAWPITRLNTTARRLTAAVLFVPVMLLVYYALYSQPTRPGAVRELAYIESHWQAGDVIVTTTDTNYVNLMNYTDKPVILLRECKLPLGGLTDQTRRAMGYTIGDWEEIDARRVWVLYTRSPLIDDCMNQQAAAILGDTPPALSQQNTDMVKAGLWMVTP